MKLEDFPFDKLLEIAKHDHPTSSAELSLDDILLYYIGILVFRKAANEEESERLFDVADKIIKCYQSLNLLDDKVWIYHPRLDYFEISNIDSTFKFELSIEDAALKLRLFNRLTIQ